MICMMIKFIKEHWKSLVWAAIIMILCGLPGDDLNKVKLINIPYFDKFVHWSLYFVFALFLISENNSQRKIGEVTYNAILIAAIISISYGALIEILQKFVFIHRGAEIWDEVANTLGFLVAAISYRLVNRITDKYI